MNEWLSIFWDQLLATTLLEGIAVFFGLVTVWYSKQEHIWVYPTGISSVLIYVYITFQHKLYADMGINGYYFVMSIYGWYVWSRPTAEKTELPITRTNKNDKLKTLGIFLFTSLFVIVVYRYYDVMPKEFGLSESLAYVWENMTSGNLEKFRSITPYLDTFTTGIFFAGMWLMANKKLENWTFWIVGNIVSIPLYFVKGYGFTGIQYFIFLILAIQGYNAWKRTLDKKTETL